MVSAETKDTRRAKEEGKKTTGRELLKEAIFVIRCMFRTLERYINFT